MNGGTLRHGREEAKDKYLWLDKEKIICLELLLNLKKILTLNSFWIIFILAIGKYR